MYNGTVSIYKKNVLIHATVGMIFENILLNGTNQEKKEPILHDFMKYLEQANSGRQKAGERLRRAEGREEKGESLFNGSRVSV